MRIFFLLTEEGLKFFWIRDSQKFRSKSFDIHGWRKNLISDAKSLLCFWEFREIKNFVLLRLREKAKNLEFIQHHRILKNLNQNCCTVLEIRFIVIFFCLLRKSFRLNAYTSPSNSKIRF